MFARVRKLLRTTSHQREIRDIDNAFQSRHFVGVDGLHGIVANKQKFRFRVVDDIVNLLTIKLMKDGHCHSSIGECGEEGHGPVGGVATADGYLVALLDITVFKEYMQFLYLPGYIMKLKGCSLIIGECVLIPIVDDCALDIGIKTTKCFH